ncbi:hypothetical protein V6N12_044202 [Hibiscus sabdariffa]|uniref:Uncharacterized protein n=1 Tax=Hibiscus sabdariffa TaxID=183260 RepID=A0ABR2DGK5_9ROSI
MEEDMDMDVELELESVFEVREIDLDYEFDAARFFDFTRVESLAEAGEAELWFESAPTYPPSLAEAVMIKLETLLAIGGGYHKVINSNIEVKQAGEYVAFRLKYWRFSS